MIIWTETPEMYAAVTEAHVSDSSGLAWLYNVLSKEKEADRVLYDYYDEVRHRDTLRSSVLWRRN